MQLLNIQRTQLCAQSRLGLKIRVSHGLLRAAEQAPHRVGTYKPQTGGDIQRVFKPWVDLLDDGT